MRNRWFYISSSILPGAPLMLWGAEQYFSLADWWSAIPFGWLTACGASVWLGYLIYDLASQESKVRAWWSAKRSLATIEFKTNTPYTTQDPVTIDAIITINRVAIDVGIYLRWADLVGYTDGSRRYAWSAQQIVTENSTCQPGRVFSQRMVALPADKKAAEVLGDSKYVNESRHPTLICIEVVASSGGASAKARKYISLMNSKQLTASVVGAHEIKGLEDDSF